MMGQDRTFDLAILDFKLPKQELEKLAGLVKEALYGPWIKKELSDLMKSTSGLDTPGFPRFGGPRRQRSITSRLIGLRLDIGRYWNDLSPDMQKFVEGFY